MAPEAYYTLNTLCGVVDRRGERHGTEAPGLSGSVRSHCDYLIYLVGWDTGAAISTYYKGVGIGSTGNMWSRRRVSITSR